MNIYYKFEIELGLFSIFVLFYFNYIHHQLLFIFKMDDSIILWEKVE